MQELLAPAQIELVIKNSRFVGEIFPVSSQEEARELLRKQKARYPDCSHVVHAFTVGRDGSILGCSDDGEPSGTAGRPVLEVLRNCPVRNAMITVTRWFGGTKLGTGGLVRAYTESAQEVLKIAETREMIDRDTVEFSVPYSLYELVKIKLAELEFDSPEETFAEEIRVCGRLPSANTESLRQSLTDLTHGKSQLNILSES